MGSRIMETGARTILTIGHSNHTLEYFVELLTLHGVTAVADVRSAPYSRFNPQFNREKLAGSLKTSKFRYVYLGLELGGRSDDRSCYEHGRVRYDRLARTPLFRDGLARILRGADRYRIALMCAEKEPLDCHRTLLVGHELDKSRVDVAHILANGTLEPHASTMSRLLAEFGLESEDDFFNRHRTRGELIEDAIAQQTKRVGHVKERTNNLARQNNQ